MRLRINRAIIGYVLIGIVMLGLFLYLRFPGQSVTDYVKAAAAARYPQLMLSIEGTQPTFPPGMAFENVTVSPGGRPEATLQTSSLRIRPGGLSLLAGRLTLLMAAEGYGGVAKGRIDFSRLFSLQGPLTAGVTLQDIRIEKCTWLREALAHPMTGTLKGALSFNGTAEALKNGTGSIDFTVTNGSYQLLESFLGIEKIDFSKVEGKASVRNGALKITQLTLTGEKLRCSLKGDIILAEDFQDSRIDMNGTIEILMKDSSRRVTLTIGGTIGKPQSRLM
jgi:type II secretion system protein N